METRMLKAYWVASRPHNTGCAQARLQLFHRRLNRRTFHDYFVTHLPSSSLHPDARSASGPHHKLPRAASKPHTPQSPQDPSPAPLAGPSRDTTVVRIPLRSAKHHFGGSVSRGTRPYNEDAFQAGVIALPAFAKKSPVSLTRAPASSPLQAFRERQQEQQSQKDSQTEGSEDASAGTPAPAGDPQVFYFGVFDGHGGTECSSFLKDSLHEYIERSAQKLGLESTLSPPKRSEEQVKASLQNALKLETSLVKRWQDLVGGYFRRFRPKVFALSEKNGINISAVMTYAFLRADLDFIAAQARKEDTDSDLVLSDAPLNASDILDSPARQIGGPKRFKGGSTCSVALVSTPTPTPFWHPATPSSLLVSHVGDTRILLCKTSNGQACPLTTNHHPGTPGEGSRLRRYAASFVTDSFGEERMTGLANTRAFGDMQSKQQGVSAEPEIRRLELAPAEYSFLVLISDGVSGTLSDQEVVDIVKEARTPEKGASDVIAFATEVSAEGDNATCLVVRLGGWERRSEGGVGSMGTKEARDWKREEARDPRSRRT
ncbi:hypothetical protein MMC25_005197 [Agyrium rufum]|nr:hypothetical protein [Agyrium rufum]